jgi:hypothetical protein
MDVHVRLGVLRRDPERLHPGGVDPNAHLVVPALRLESDAEVRKRAHGPLVVDPPHRATRERVAAADVGIDGVQGAVVAEARAVVRVRAEGEVLAEDHVTVGVPHPDVEEVRKTGPPFEQLRRERP